MSSDRRQTKNVALPESEGPVSSDLRMSIVNAKIALCDGDVESGTRHLNAALALTEIVNGLETRLPILAPRVRHARRMRRRK